MVKAPTSPQDRSPFAEALRDFSEALEVLYIKNNLSGRQKFRAAWPQAAVYVLGETLLRFDAEGGVDREARAQEELQAEERRLGLLDLIMEAREKSVEGGMLQLSYIENIMHQLGPELSATVYSPWVMDKVFPPAPVKMEIKPSPQDISEDFNFAPIDVQPAAQSLPKIALRSDGQSPFNLGQKKTLVQIEAVARKKLSYSDFVARVEKLFSQSITNSFNRVAH